MRRYITACLFLSFLVLFFSSCAQRRLIRERFRNLEGKEEIVVVIIGNSFYETRWKAETDSYLRNYLKQELGRIFTGRLSIINSSRPDDTVHSLRLRVQADVLSYRPDLVFLMIGLFDSNTTAMSTTTYREQIKELFGVLKKHDVFVIVLSAVGFRDATSIYDSRMERLEEFNEVTVWEAGHHGFPVIDVAGYVERLRLTDTEEYQSLFKDNMRLNEKGQKFVIDYVVRNLNKAYGRRD